MVFSIDRFVTFDSFVHVRGWIFGSSPLCEVSLAVDGEVIGSSGPLPSADVALQYPEYVHAGLARFDIKSYANAMGRINAVLIADFADSSRTEIPDIGLRGPKDAGHACYGDFVDELGRMSPGNFLEIGARARSGVTRRDVVPPTWHYTGFDILPGPNVDVVGDAHDMRRAFPEKHFDAVMAISVLEHILMPWKMVLELNYVMKPGGIALFHTHQTWPVHDAPWDFWRFSIDAWPALFNAKTGFEIVQRGMGGPTFLVPLRVAEGTNFREQVGYLVSGVIVRKVSNTLLSWDVSVNDAIETVYPA